MTDRPTIFADTRTVNLFDAVAERRKLEAWAADYIARNGTIDSHYPQKPFDYGPTVEIYARAAAWHRRWDAK